MAGKGKNDPREFWARYEASLGEKVLAYGLGQYLSGWAGFDPPLWGLLIATDRGFRFHHFPQDGWMRLLARVSGGDAPTEKTAFIPRERILAAELRSDTSLFKKVFLARSPRLAIRYADSDGAEAEFLAEADSKASRIIEKLQTS